MGENWRNRGNRLHVEPVRSPKKTPFGLFLALWLVYRYQMLVTVAGTVPHPRGETGTYTSLLAASGEQKRCPFFQRKQVNTVVLGCFGVLRCGFGCDCGWCLFVSVVFMLWLRFLLVVVVFCCFLLFFVVFCCFVVFLDVAALILFLWPAKYRDCD